MAPVPVRDRDPSANSWECPACGSGLANCHGVLACTDCAWVERD